MSERTEQQCHDEDADLRELLLRYAFNGREDAEVLADLFIWRIECLIDQRIEAATGARP
jgi:hypothetical protein